ncbi:MAG: carbohydrate ABC transporter permease, partial [Chthoniobacterales bacterium]
MSEKTKSRLFLSVLLGPALIVIFAVVAFPLVYNFLLSFSNANIYHIRDWRLIGFAQYVSVFQQQLFWSILLKTVLWTAVNITFHVVIGVFLAVVLHQKFIRGKSVWRVLLILPWALPQYITALTWRGMFNYEYGAVNLLITKYLHLPPVQWLTSPFEAFVAVIVTNIWLGF